MNTNKCRDCERVCADQDFITPERQCPDCFHEWWLGD